MEGRHQPVTIGKTSKPLFFNRNYPKVSRIKKARSLKIVPYIFEIFGFLSGIIVEVNLRLLKKFLARFYMLY